MATPTPVEILRIPLISTVHQPSSLCWYEQDIFPVVNTETGTMVLFADDLDPFVTLPRWLWTLSTWATDNGFTWVWFDADARPVDALPTYDWTED
jgi:hypothetical protein